MQPDEHGGREVREGGPLDLGGVRGGTYIEWECLDRPGWDRLGLTVTPDGRHRVWLDNPESAHAWDLPTD